MPLGGWWGHVLLGQRVDILTAGGVVPSVVGCKPPHFLSKQERDRVLGIDKMYLDVGASNHGERLRTRIDRVGAPRLALLFRVAPNFVESQQAAVTEVGQVEVNALVFSPDEV